MNLKAFSSIFCNKYNTTSHKQVACDLFIVLHKLLEANYATQYTYIYSDIPFVLKHDRLIDQYQIEKIDRSTKKLIITSLDQ